jgi:hypothetical protein
MFCELGGEQNGEAVARLRERKRAKAEAVLKPSPSMLIKF